MEEKALERSATTTSAIGAARGSRQEAAAKDNHRPIGGGRRRLVLVALDWHRAKDPRLPLGHVSLLAALHVSDVVDLVPRCFHLNQASFSLEVVTREILRACKGVSAGEVDLAVGAYVWNEPYLNPLFGALCRAGFAGRIILGGPQVSYTSDGLESLYPEVDVFIRGYGEEALVKVVATEDPVLHAGVHYAGTEDRGESCAIELPRLPSPLMDGAIHLETGQCYVRWETQRGCPFRCSFCQHHEAGARLKARALGKDRIRREQALLIERRPQEISVLDPIFNLGPASTEILRGFQRARFQGKLSLQCRFERLDDDFLNACKGLNVVLEFGLQTIHENEGRAVRRFNRRDKVEEAVGRLHEAGVGFEVSIIYGLPEQTLESFRETVRVCQSFPVPVIKAFPLMLLRGTPLEQDRDRWGLVENDDIIPAVVASSTFSHADWVEMRRIADGLANSMA